jgi:hypothetical protein
MALKAGVDVMAGMEPAYMGLLCRASLIMSPYGLI